MKKNKILISIIGIILIILIFLIKNYFEKPKEQIFEEILRQDYNEISNLVKNSNVSTGKYLIENKVIQGNNLNKKLNIESYGEIYKINEKDLYGYLIYSNKCYKFDQFSYEEFIDSNKCQSLKVPQDMLTLISGTNSDNIKEDNVETGFDLTDDYGSKYYFTGKNPNNYVVFSNKCFRIINVSKNGSTKIIFENNINENTNNCEEVTSNVSGNIGVVPWDRDRDKQNIKNWDESSLKKIMDDWLLEEKIDMGIYDFKLDIKYLENIYWNIGMVDNNNKNVTDVIKDEVSLKTKNKSQIGLISVSDYAKVNCNSLNNDKKACIEDNYLYKEKYNWWTINSGSKTEKTAWIIEKDGMLVNKLIPFSHEYYFSGIRPVFYLKSDIQYIGEGSEKNPYKIIN